MPIRCQHQTPTEGLLRCAARLHPEFHPVDVGEAVEMGSLTCLQVMQLL